MNKSRELDQLVSKVEALLARLPDNPQPEIAALRNQVDNAIFETWTAVARERAAAKAAAADLIDSVNDYVRAHPWLIVGGTFLLAGSVSYLAASFYRRPRAG